jgi:uncharacterized protein (TIGR02118 family)
MIKVSVLYPNDESANFDMAYYCDKHVPMVRQLLGSSCRNAAIEKGIAGGTPGSKPTYTVMGNFFFDKVEDFISSITPHADVINGDIANFTNTTPVFQISEVIL